MSFLVDVLACVGILVSIQLVRMVISGLQLKAHSYIFIAQVSPLRLLVPSWTDIRGLIYGNLHTYKYKHSEYERAGMDAYVQVSATDPTHPCFFIADPRAIKDLTRPRAPFVHNVKNGAAFLGPFGPNLVTLEGEEWKQHRNITQRAFTEKNLQLVFSDTIVALEQLFRLWDKNYGQRVHVPHVTDVTKTLALMVISSAAFGQKLTWIEDTEKPDPGFEVSFHKAISTVSQTMIRRRMTPTWAETWTKTNRDMVFGFSELGRYFQRMMAAHRNERDSAHGSAEKGWPGNSLFRILMNASEEDQAEKGEGFSDEAIAGNTFLFLFAGHETTANTLSFSLGLLALYPEIQQEAYLQVKQVMDSDGGLMYTTLKELKVVSGTLYEALRMYPPVLQVARIAEKDATISVARNGPGTDEYTRSEVFIPSGSHIMMSVIGTHYNPKNWPEPEEFRPARFSEPYNKDAFLAWSNGRRACVGQKFAETEGVAALATILARYEVSIDASKFADIPGESMNARRERLLRPALLFTLGPEKLPLVFTRR